jgi:hypothetical protein
VDLGTAARQGRRGRGTSTAGEGDDGGLERRWISASPERTGGGVVRSRREG